jgi:Thioredoxin like C-terminal domain
MRPDEPHADTTAARLRLNHWALSGDWTMEEQATTLNTANGRIAYRFRARDLHLVMGPQAVGICGRFGVLIDGQPPGAEHGIDVDRQGNGTVTEQRLYQLIRQRGPITDRTSRSPSLTPAFRLTHLPSARRERTILADLVSRATTDQRRLRQAFVRTAPATATVLDHGSPS